MHGKVAVRLVATGTTIALAALAAGTLLVTGQELSPAVTAALQNGTVNSPIWAGDTLNLTVTGGSVDTNAAAVMLNVTVTDTSAASYLTIFPAGAARPLASNLNWSPGQTVANLVSVSVGTSGQVSIYNDAGSTDVLVDVEGYFMPPLGGSTAGAYIPLNTTRIADTRRGSGEPDAGQTLKPGGTINIQVAGAGNVPATNVAAAVLNITATDTTANSFLTVYPESASRPPTSNLNWEAGRTAANCVIVPISSNGQITVFNASGNVDLVVDVSGYLSASAGESANATLYNPIVPVRVLDSRIGSEGPGAGGTIGAGSLLSQQLAGLAGIGSDATAVTANVTVTDTTDPGYLTVYPGGVPPLTSTLNWSSGQTVSNLALPSLSSSGELTAYTDLGQADVIMDVSGWFAPASTATGDVYVPLAPTRILDTRSDPSQVAGETSAFIGRSGTQLTLDAQPYTFTGINIFMAASGGTPSSCGGELYPNVGVALSDMPSGIVFRFYAFQNFFVSHGAFDWANFDQVLTIAAAHGDRVIPILANQYSECDGPAKDLAWYQSGYRTAVEPVDIVTYRQYVAEVVSRYADNPTIAIWQLVNEGEAVNADGTCNEPAALSALLAFSNDVGGMVHSLDPSHLVSLGTIAGYSGTGQQWCGAANGDYQTLMASPGNDVCDFHDYGYPTDPMGDPQTPDLATAIQMCHADDKPIMVAETGLFATSNSELAVRAADFKAKFAAQFNAGVVGELMWEWANLPDYVVPATDADYGIFPNDPSLTLLGTS
jgi:hypothetical protein